HSGIRPLGCIPLTSAVREISSTRFEQLSPSAEVRISPGAMSALPRSSAAGGRVLAGLRSLQAHGQRLGRRQDLVPVPALLDCLSVYTLNNLKLGSRKAAPKNLPRRFGMRSHVIPNRQLKIRRASCRERD